MRGRRAGAFVVDLFLAAVLATLLRSTVGEWFAHRAVDALAIGEPDTLWRGGVPMVLGAVGNWFYGLPFAMLLLQAPRLLLGTTPGRALVRIPVDRDRRRAVLALSSWGLLVVGLVVGSAEVTAAGLLAFPIQVGFAWRRP